MSARNPWHPDQPLHRDGAASQSSLPLQPPGDPAQVAGMSDAWDQCGLTSQDRAAVRNIYLLFESSRSGGMRVDTLADLQSSNFHPHSAHAWDDDPPRSTGRLWIRAVCVLIAAGVVLAGWIWLVRLLLAA